MKTQTEKAAFMNRVGIHFELSAPSWAPINAPGPVQTRTEKSTNPKLKLRIEIQMFPHASVAMAEALA